MLNRIRTHWTIAALIVLVGLQLWVGSIWILTDARAGDGVCCSFTAPVFDILLADGTDQLGWPWSRYRRSMGLLVWPALWAHKLTGSSPDALLWLNLLTGVLCQVCLYGIGRRLSSGLAGLVAAGIFPMIPAVAFVHRRWDALAPQHLVLLAALWLLLLSSNLTRWLPTLGFVLVAMIGCVLSARETDNLLFMAAVGAMTLGAAGRGLSTGQGPIGREHPGRTHSLLGGLIVAAVMGVFCWWYAFPLVDFAYFGDEMGNSSYEQGAAKRSLGAIFAYPMRIYSDDLTPWLAWPFLGGLGLWLRRGAGRAEVGAWLLLPLVALALVGKKNFYYAAVIYPGLALVLGLGLGALKHKRIPLGLATGLLLLGWMQFSSRSLPSSTFPKALGTVDWTGTVGPQQHLFQGIVPLNLAPRGPSEVAKLLPMLSPRITESSCDCPQQLVVHGQGDYSELLLRLKTVDPCLTMSAGSRVDHPDSVGWVLTTQSACGSTTAPAGVPRLQQVAEQQTGQGCAQLYKRTGRRLCGTTGSPPE
jgi:hypothetical protein